MGFGMQRFVWVAAVALTVSVSGFAVAQGVSLKPEEIVWARQGGMALTGSVTDMIKAGLAAGVDVKTFEEPAAALLKWANAYPHLFPEGTQGVANTKARAEIWSDRAGFDKAAAAFVTASTNLEAAAKSGDKAAFTAAFTAEGQSCGGCHRSYKAR